MSTILVVEDEEILRESTAEVLMQEGYRVLTAADGAKALALFNANPVHLIVSDLRLPVMDGLQLLRACRTADSNVPFIIATAFGSIETAIDAMRHGATDYLMKPVNFDELVTKVKRTLESEELRAENKMLRRDLNRKLGSFEMVGTSPALVKTRELIRKVAPARSAVLITGESGTGKELIARAIHELSAAKNEPFVPVNCAAIPESLLENELFGHRKGSFTGAIADSEGLFRSARKGTLFLDEIGELPLSLQAKLLRVLEDKMVQPVGASKLVPFEGRILAATNRNLRQDILDRKFREDLYYRLAVLELHSAPLRERRDDILLLANHFLRKFNGELNRSYTGFDDAARAALQKAPWKGNIRELQNTIERAMILGTEPLVCNADILSSDLRFSITTDAPNNLREAMAAYEKAHIETVLAKCNNDKKQAALALGISLSSFYRLLGGATAEEVQST